MSQYSYSGDSISTTIAIFSKLFTQFLESLSDFGLKKLDVTVGEVLEATLKSEVALYGQNFVRYDCLSEDFTVFHFIKGKYIGLDGKPHQFNGEVIRRSPSGGAG